VIRIILFGAPGAGKGTISGILEKKYNYKKISTGDLIRDEIRSNSIIGKKVRSVVDKGELVSDDIIIEIVKNRVTSKYINEGYIMDGFPRTIIQAKELSKMVTDSEVAIYLKVEDEKVIINRLLSRVICNNCGAIFNTKNKPPKKEGICDICGGILEKRTDDNEGAIRERLRVYREVTEPIINYYEDKGVLNRVDASISVREVLKKIGEILN